ncbi:MAG: ABC transporter substrate-binding protein [Pseudomonadota bacterium]|jgi:branched-chain amino acid transport system substrate-binding protein
MRVISRSRLLVCFFAFSVLSCQLSSLHAQEPAASSTSSKEVKIGVVIPLTGSQAGYGVEAARLFQLLSEEPGYQLDGIRFRFIIEDGKCGVGNAPITAAKKLVLVDKVNYIIAGCSGEVLQIAPFTEQKKVVLFGYVSAHRDVKHAGDYVFRTMYDIGEIGTATREKLKDLGFTKLAVVSEETSFTMGIKDVLIDALGKQIVSKEDYPLDNPDRLGIVTRTRQRNPDAVFINAAAPPSYIQIYNELRRAGFRGPIFSYYQAGSKEVIEALGSTHDNVWYLSPPDTRGDATRYAEMRQRYIKRFGEEINSEFQLATVYNALQSIVDSVVAVGDFPDKVRNHLLSYSAPGATGPISYDSNGDIKNVSIELKKIEGGKLVRP